jgi:hypothetical protein
MNKELMEMIDAAMKPLERLQQAGDARDNCADIRAVGGIPILC